jgi:hypothetical protein
MLTFESPFYEIEDVIVFRDHASPTMFYYLAGPPHLTVSDGQPNLLLLKYKNAIDSMAASKLTREQLGGAFLLFGVDCGLSESTKNTIKGKLQEFVPDGGGEISLAPVLYTKGTVSVVALDQQKSAATADDAGSAQKSQFIRGILGSATPSLLQDQRAIFSISLTPDAATLIEQAYESDLSPIGVMYQLDFTGLRPALSVSAQVDMKRVYEALKLGLHVGVASGSGAPPGTTTTTTASSTTTTSSPTTTTASPSTTTTTTTPAPAATTTTTTTPRPAVSTVNPTGPATAPAATTTTTTTPTTAAPQNPQATGTGVYVSADIGYTLEQLKQEEAIKITIVREQEGASVDQMEKNAMDMLQQTILNTFFQPAMTDTPAAAAAGAVGAASQMMATSADTNKGVSGKTQVQIGFQLQYKKDEELKTATFDYTEVAPETRTHAPNGFFSALLSKTDESKHIREINLDDPFFKTLDVQISSIADFGSLNLLSIDVQMQYGGTPAQPAITGDATFMPTKADPQRFQAFVERGDYSYRHAVNYGFGQSENVAAQSFESHIPFRTSTSRALIINPLEDIPMIHVYLEPGLVDWDVVAQIETELSYNDPGNNFQAQRTFLLKSDSKRQDWIVRATNPELMSYQVKNRWHMKDMSIKEGAGETRNDVHLIIADPFVDRLPVTVDPHVDPANVARIDVELVYEDTANNFTVRKQVELEAPYKRITVTIPIVDPKKREYSYTISLVKPNGQAEVHVPKVTDQLSIIITEGGVYLDVDVVLIGDFNALSVDALQVDMQAEPLDGAQPKIESHLVMPTDPKRFTQRLLLRADRPTEYQYRTVVISKGNEIDSDWNKAQSKILLLQVQRLLQGR